MLNEFHKPKDADGEPISELDPADIRGFMRNDVNSYGISLVEAVYGKKNLLDLKFGFNLTKPGPVMKYSMPHGQVRINQGKHYNPSGA